MLLVCPFGPTLQCNWHVLEIRMTNCIFSVQQNKINAFKIIFINEYILPSPSYCSSKICMCMCVCMCVCMYVCVCVYVYILCKCHVMLI